MKKILLSLFPFIIFAQWQPEYRLTNSEGYSVNCAIASNENNLHVVWQENRDGNQEIYYKRSTDDGLSWESDVRLTNNLEISYTPSISVSGTFVYVVWVNKVGNDFRIFFKRSQDNGTSWGAEIQLTNNRLSGNPVVSASGQFVQLIWKGISASGFFEIFHNRSSDGGATWSADSQLTIHTSGLPGTPTVSTTGLNVHTAFPDTRDGGNNEIYYKRSTDGGETWESDIRLTNNASMSEEPSITSSSQEVHIAWFDLRDGNIEIYHKRSTDGGTTWGTDTRITMGPFASQNPSIVLSGTIIHLVWQYGFSNYDIFYKRSMDSGVSWEDSTQISNSVSGVRDAAISTSSVSTHIAWTDYRHGSTNHELYYRQDPTGNVLTGINFDPNILEQFSLLQNYPNPFNPSTKIKYSIPSVTLSGVEGSLVTLKVYDVLGNEVAKLVDEEKTAGSYEVEFNAAQLSSGIYFYKLSAGSFTETKKMTVLK